MFAKRIPGKPTIAPTIPDITAKTSLNDHRGGGLPVVNPSFFMQETKFFTNFSYHAIPVFLLVRKSSGTNHFLGQIQE